MNRFDIVQVYRNYCDLQKVTRSRNSFEGSGHVETQMANGSKHALEVLLMQVKSSLQTWNSIIYELSKLMSYLNLMVDFSEFSRFYGFVFFVCRENGQKNITVSIAVRAWRLVLDGRFRLLNQWCDFVENNQRHNISEDTWQQVLAFSRCVHENLEGYDPEGLCLFSWRGESLKTTGAWPVLIDDFVEHMYRVSGSNKTSKSRRNCGASESQSGLKILPGLKRKLPEDMQLDGNEPCTGWMEPSPVASFKKSRCMECKPVYLEVNTSSCTADEIQNNGAMGGCSESPCAVEGYLSKGFAGLFSTRSFLGLDQERKASFTRARAI